MSEKFPNLEQQEKPEPTPLTRELAEKIVDQLVELANRIPGAPTHTQEDILAESKGERQMLGKWDHSFVTLESEKPIAMIMGYERTSEGNEQYPENTLYISELAVAEGQEGKGLARALIQKFLDDAREKGFLHLEGNMNFSVQTNSAEWNQRVINLYQSFGFVPRATKEYSGEHARTDLVLGLT